MELAFKSAVELLRRPFVLKFSFAILTQSLLSLTNLIIGIVIAKYASKSEYGMYVILFSIIGLVGNYQGAIVNTPLTVLLPAKNAQEKQVFLAGLGYGQWVFFIPLTLLAIIIGSIYSYKFQDVTIITYFLVVSFATVTYLLREFIRTINYSKLRIGLIVKMDVFFVFITSIGFVLLVIFQKLTSSFSIIVLGIGYLSTALFERVHSNEKYYFDWHSIKNVFIETWQYSRWALLGVTSDIFKNRGYIYIVTVSLGLETIADISAARLFIMPVGLIVVSSGKMILAKGAGILNLQSKKKFKQFVILLFLLMITIWSVYVLILWVGLNPLTSLLGEKYKNIGGFILLWGFFFLIYSMRYSITTALSVCKEFKAMSKYDIISAIITTMACLILTRSIGGYGAIISLTLGEGVLLMLAMTRFVKVLRDGN